MFQRLTSLFFSDSSTPEGLEEPKPFVEEEEEEDGWLIIDLAGEQSSRTVFPQPLLHLVSSWFVTPPPCFTAEEPGPDGVGSSPMEDLLIEHPSMSVYVTSTLEVDGEEGVGGAAAPAPTEGPALVLPSQIPAHTQECFTHGQTVTMHGWQPPCPKPSAKGSQ
uniref:Tumor protein p53 inducible nuclear protein 2 n=1 Tax=Zonotrichia albicollis TaxID=44394 RepID=A0A8D2N9J9_ZONAL